MMWIIFYLLLGIIGMQVILTLVFMAYGRAARRRDKHWVMVLKNQMNVQQDVKTAVEKIEYVTNTNKPKSGEK